MNADQLKAIGRAIDEMPDEELGKLLDKHDPSCACQYAELERIILSDRDAETFINALENPPEPNEALKKLWKAHNE